MPICMLRFTHCKELMHCLSAERYSPYVRRCSQFRLPDWKLGLMTHWHFPCTQSWPLALDAVIVSAQMDKLFPTRAITSRNSVYGESWVAVSHTFPQNRFKICLISCSSFYEQESLLVPLEIQVASKDLNLSLLHSQVNVVIILLL